MKIACVGGGPASLYFALLMKLRDVGHDITVFERNGAGSSSGWGVTFDGGRLEGESFLPAFAPADSRPAQ